jgi:tetratricopeptide (TPR) repeat protein
MQQAHDALAAAKDLAARGKYAQAETALARLLTQNPHNHAAMHVLAVIARNTSRLNFAIELLRDALRLDSSEPVYHFELGISLSRAGQLEAALTHFRRAADLKPDYQDAVVNTGTLLDRLGRNEEAREWFQRAIELDPTCSIARFNLGNTHRTAGRLVEAIACFDEALALSPKFAKAHWNKSLCHLLRGEWEAGWREYSWRDSAGEVVLDHYREPRWLGESLIGKTILLHAEQGIGDEILFASCLPDAIAQARRCIVVCDRRLQPLFARSFPKAIVHGHARRKDRTPFQCNETIDVQAPLGDLACHFRKTSDSFPTRDSYILPDPAKVAAWRQRFCELPPGLKVGISWRAGGHAHERAKRSTVLDQWLPALSQPAVRFINLQYGESTADLQELQSRHGIVVHDWPAGDPLVDLDDFAAKVAALDLVVSVGNTTVHLAGALGVPAWVLLPTVPGWRWLIEGETNPWYSSVRAIRQQRQGDWATVFDQVARQLAGMINANGPKSQHTIEIPRAFPSVTSSPVVAPETFNLNARLKLGFDAVRAGDRSRAESIFQEVLAHAPLNVAALHQLGLLARQENRMEVAIRLLTRAAAAAESNAAIYLDLARAHHTAQELAQAADNYQRALAIDPTLAEAHFELGAVFRCLNRPDDALAAYRRTIELNPAHAKAHNFLGATYIDLRRHTEAEHAFRRAIELVPEYAAARNNLGYALELAQSATIKRNSLSPQLEARLREAAGLFNSDQIEAAAEIAQEVASQTSDHPVALRILAVAARRAKRHDESISLLKRALVLDPDSHALHFELGVSCLENHNQKDAYHCFLRCQQLRPDFQPSYINLAGILEQQERYDESLAWGLKAIELKPDCHMAHYNLANCYRERGDIETAILHYGRALEILPSYARAEWNLGICHLHLGNYEQGWTRYELREAAEDVKIDRYTQPRWNGESLQGKAIVVHAEQGIGDEVVFCSCIPELLPLAGRVIIVCDPRLEKLFRRSFPQATVYPWQRKKDWAPYPLTEHADFQVPMGSLPRFLRPTRDHFPKRDRFLVPDPNLIAQWRDRFESLGPGLKIGISWRAGGKPLERRKRSTPLELWASIFAARNVHFINLQYGDSIDDAAEVYEQFGLKLHDWEQGDPLIDMDSFAAKIAALDLVISVGNATVHLAGSVGTPAWTLLPMIPSWRWMVRGDKSPWYSSVRLFRQPSRNDWPPVFDRLGRMLSIVANSPPTEYHQQATTVDVPLQAQVGSLKRAGAIDDHQWLDFSQYSVAATVETIPATIKQADEACQRGDFELAEELFRRVLTVAPRYATALHGLGIVARRLGKTELAIRSFKRALTTPELVHVRRCDLAAALADAGRFDDAAESYLRAIEIAPNYYPAHFQFGLMLQRQGWHSEAIARLRQAASLATDKAEPLIAVAASQRAMCQTDAALRSLQTAVSREPASAAAHIALARLCHEDHAFPEAKQYLENAISLNPQALEPRFLLGELLESAGKSDEAILAYIRVLKIDADHYATLIRLGTLHAQLGQPAKAETAYRSALRLVETPPRELVNSLGTTLADQGRLEESLEYYDWALQLSGNQPYPIAHANRAFALLQLGRYAEGWRDYEWRWQCADSGRPRDHLRVPAWDGSPLDGKTILVHGEQGVGDEIMFATCYPDIIDRAAQVVLACEPRLEKLFRRAFPSAMVIAVLRGHEHQWQIPPKLRVDYHIPSGSLPLHFRPTAESFPLHQRLLVADPDLVSRWRERFAALGDGLKVGIAWRAGEKSKDVRTRSTRLEQWNGLLSIPEVQFVNLQHGDCADELAELKRELGVEIHHWGDADNRNDLDGLAARISALDLVISVGNATVHLAGALGVPAWSLLPCHGGWRWRRNSETTVWYQSVRLMRQPRPGDWTGLFAQVRKRLLDLTREHSDELTMRRIPAPHFASSARAQRLNETSPGPTVG